MNQQTTVADLWRQLGAAPTAAASWLDLARAYAAEDLPWQAGYTARQALRLDPGLLPSLQSLALGPWQNAALGDALLGRAHLPAAAALAERFALQVQACAGDWLSWLYLARLQELAGVAALRQPSAEPEKVSIQAAIQPAIQQAIQAALQQAQALEPLAGESLHWIGVWRLNAGDAAGAVAALAGLLNIRPVRCGSMMYLGEALLRTGQIAAAEKAFARASLSDNPDLLLTLSERVFQHNYWQEAVAVLNKALTLRPTSVPILLALSKIHWEVHDLTRAQDCCRQVLAIDPRNEEVTYMLAALPGRMGDAKGHFEAVRAKLAASADPDSRLASSIAMAALYHDGLSAQTVADLHRSLCAPIEAALEPQRNFQNTCEPGRRLRVGYVTGDFHRQHPVNIFMLPVLLRHDHAKVEVFVYYTGTMHDDYTRQAQTCADHWLEAVKLDDKALQQAILADKIDILIDLAGHTASHRLGVLALRAAPVQATFLGYPHSTGLSTIDWLVGDATVSPAAHAHLFSEGIAQMPASVFCWAPVDDYPLPLARPARAPVVFGSFNNAMKLSPTTVALWADVLRAVPGAQLLLKAPSLKDATVQARFSALFAAQGIGPERLQLRGPSGLAEMMQEYGELDIALDPTPYNGGTTTLQALWMGVPVVALRGGNFVSRMGASFLQTLGRPAWLADDRAAYVAAALALAAQVAHLRGQRAQLRAQMAASPLCDITTYVTDFEALLQRMWALHCVGDKPALIRAGAD